MFDPFAALDRLRSRPPGRATMLQTWKQLTFLHWAVEPDALQERLPPGLEADILGGVSYVSFVPFTMVGIRKPGVPPVPWVSAFHEWNLRTYVTGPHGPGVWFFSLEAANPLAVLIARKWFKLPYHFAKMTMESGNRSTTYSSSRIWPEPISSLSRVKSTWAGEPSRAVLGSLEFWLLERYLLYSRDARGLLSARVHHEPYRFSPASLVELELDIPRAQGFADLKDPLAAVQFVPQVDVEIFAPRRVSDLGLVSPRLSG